VESLFVLRATAPGTRDTMARRGRRAQAVVMGRADGGLRTGASSNRRTAVTFPLFSAQLLSPARPEMIGGQVHHDLETSTGVLTREDSAHSRSFRRSRKVGVNV
jgi:hypothetical protein